MKITDKQRLAFLEKNKLNLYAVTQEKKHYNTDGAPSYGILKEFVGWATSDSYDKFDNVREAIDAAIKGNIK